MRLENIGPAEALVDPARMRIVNAIVESPKRELYISQIVEATNMSRPTVVHHLRVLEKTGLVRSRYIILKQPSSKGRAARVFSVDQQKLAEAVKTLEQQFQKLLDRSAW
jgi:DNA-binding transcriptional ArsR family regulator